MANAVKNFNNTDEVGYTRILSKLYSHPISG